MKSIYASVILPAGILIGAGCYHGTTPSLPHDQPTLSGRDSVAMLALVPQDSFPMQPTPLTQSPSSLDNPWVARTLVVLTRWGLQYIGNPSL